jgi:hypothetical protein
VDEPVEMPPMNLAQQQSWHALMDLYERVSSNWALIGGQLVHLHCAERGVLIPEGVGERAGGRAGAGGAPTIPSPGTTQALHRSEPVLIRAEGRTGTVLRPNLVGALVGKAAARTEIASDRASTRHCTDFVVLAHLVSARDFRETELDKKDRTRLRTMITYCRKDDSAMSLENATEALARLERAAKLNR